MAPRFSVTYFVRASDMEKARHRALNVALEQTVEVISCNSLTSSLATVPSTGA